MSEATWHQTFSLHIISMYTILVFYKTRTEVQIIWRNVQTGVSMCRPLQQKPTSWNNIGVRFKLICLCISFRLYNLTITMSELFMCQSDFHLCCNDLCCGRTFTCDVKTRRRRCTCDVKTNCAVGGHVLVTRRLVFRPYLVFVIDCMEFDITNQYVLHHSSV